MVKDIKSDIDKMMGEAMSNASKFAPLDSDRIQELTKAFTDAFEALQTVDHSVLSEWTNTWLQYQQEMTQVWMNALTQSPETMPSTKDRRFQDESWNEGIFPLLRQSYELTAKAMSEMAGSTGLSEHEQKKLEFYTQMTADNLSPSNFAMTNPEVLKLAKESGGKNLVDGFQNLMTDLQKGYITTTDESAFEVGVNLGSTAGSVVARTDLAEIIHYAPTVKKIRSNPIVIVPPCVNKFYIFDLNERKSMVRYLLELGQDVYMVSWRNPSKDMGDFGWDEYIELGIYEGLKVASSISGSDKVNLMSWCNGGTMLTAALAVLPDDLKALVGSATFLSSMIDFSDPGDLKIFVDQPQIDAYNMRLQSENLAPGRDIANAMAMLHVNDSIWNFVISNYLMGKTPAPFDVLYWNSDTSDLPSKWYSYYIEEMFNANKLMQPGALNLQGKPVDTRNIDVPCYFVAATGDHIVPWTTSFTAMDLIGGPCEFVLTSGGHVSGTVINHPVKNRKRYWSEGKDSTSPQSWQDSAAISEGSWWPHWLTWLQSNNPSTEVAAPKNLGNRTYKATDPAPGKYVRQHT